MASLGILTGSQHREDRLYVKPGKKRHVKGKVASRERNMVKPSSKVVKKRGIETPAEES